MDLQDAVTLTVNGMDYSGWKKVSISASIESQCREFSVDVTWQWARDVPIPIRQGDRCAVRIGADHVLTGYVFKTPINYDARQISRGVAGRSKPADLVDCAAINKPGQWRGESMQSIVRALASTYNIEVVSQVAESSQITEHTIEPGETVFESIDRLLTLSRLLSTDDELGRLVIVAPGSAGRAVDRLELGENILTGRSDLDFSGVFSEYRVVGQRSRKNDDESDEGGEDAPAASEISATVTDPRVARRRVLLIQESGQMTTELAQARANWERGNRIGKALTLKYKVQGWRQSNGALWRVNMIVRVVDSALGIDRDMLISEAQYDLDESGTTCSLTVAPAEAFLPEPQDPHKARKLKKGGDADNFEYLIPADWKPE